MFVASSLPDRPKVKFAGFRRLGVDYARPLAKITVSSSTTAAQSTSWVIPMTLNMTTSLRRLTAWKKPRSVLPRPMSRRNYRKSAASAITWNLPEFISVRNVALNRWPGKTLKQTNPVGWQRSVKRKLNTPQSRNNPGCLRFFSISVPAQRKDALSVTDGVLIPIDKNSVCGREGYITPRSKSHLK